MHFEHLTWGIVDFRAGILLFSIGLRKSVRQSLDKSVRQSHGLESRRPVNSWRHIHFSILHLKKDLFFFRFFLFFLFFFTFVCFCIVSKKKNPPHAQ